MNTKTRKILTGVMLAGVAFAASVEVATARGNGFSGPFGQMGGQMGPQMGPMAMDFATMDADGNGQVTLADLQALAAGRFEASDADGNGTLDKAEVMAQITEMMAKRATGDQATGQRGGWGGAPSDTRLGFMVDRMIGFMDADDDGLLSLAEMQPADEKLDRFIDRFDTDDDNALSEAEFTQMTRERGQSGHRGPHGSRSGHNGHRFGDNR